MPKKKHAHSSATPTQTAVFAAVDELLALRGKVGGLMLSATRRPAYSGAGTTRSPFRTRGLDFQEVRAYQAGDDIRQIDWRVTAKYGKPFTKLYTDEKERDVFVICDMRPGMKFASNGRFKSVVAARVAMFLSFLALKKGDRLGFALLTAAGLEIVPPETGETVVVSLARALSAASDPTVTTTGAATLTDALKTAKKHVKRGGILFVLSDFTDLTTAAAKHFAALTDQKTVSLIHIYDDIEADMPAGVYPITDGSETAFLDMRANGQKYRADFEKIQASITATAQKYQTGYMTIKTTDADLERIASFVKGGLA